ncbi:YbgC/FadM family acyl-CoA thioesterase [Rhodoplanes azumiensis]|uniref:YbgC/FadM family acyl-CoA thioesterase n=1 Tax=Rhodoplanes azumiensis TaxID=1897628 RepID=A0ABW5AF14_9BRAD
MRVRVYIEDTDFSGIVYHASYLRFLERARTNYMRLLGVHQHRLWDGTNESPPRHAFVVRAMTLEFLKPAVMDDLLTITTATDAVGGASMMLAQTITRGATLLIEARARIALVSGGRARPFPKSLRLALQMIEDRRRPANLVPT